MKEKRSGILCLCISIGGFFLMSVSFLLMPFSDAGYLPGVLFWLGLLTGTATQMILERKRRDFFKSYGVNRSRMQKPRCGALTFGSNKIAVVADAAVPVCAAATIATVVLTNSIGYSCYVCISLTVFAFSMHCICNGRNYFHVINQNKIRRVLEKKQVSKTGKEEGRK